MRISRAIIKNYRNLKDVDVRLENLVTLIGENNSGKSNFLRALTLPLLTDENGLSKQLSWHDINNSCKNDFYQYLNKNREAIVNGRLELANFIPNIPEVAVSIELEPTRAEHYDLKDLLVEERDGGFIACIQYRYYVDKPEKLFERVRGLLTSTVDVTHRSPPAMQIHTGG